MLDLCPAHWIYPFPVLILPPRDDREEPKPEPSPDPPSYPQPDEFVPDAATHSPTQMRIGLNKLGSEENFDEDHSKRHRYSQEKADKALPKYGSGIH